MFPEAMHLLPIKDLKDLSVFFWSAGFYRHAGPKGPEEMFSRGRSRRTGPRATVKKNAPLTVGRGPVPRHAIGHASIHPLCRARAPALDPFGSRHSRTTVASRSVGP